MNQLLKPEHHNPQWIKGVPRIFLQPEWDEILTPVWLYITYEGRYTMVQLYQMCFLCHIVGIRSINIPYIILRSLSKMSAKIKENPGLPPHFVYHRGLIKILIQYQLSLENQNLDHFLLWEGFKINIPQSSKGKRKTPMKTKGTPDKQMSSVVKPSSIERTTKSMSKGKQIEEG